MTPNSTKHGGLPPLASRFVDVAGLPWESTRFAGVQQKILVVDPDSGVVNALMKFAPGAKLPEPSTC